MSDLIKRADVIKAIEELRKEPHWLHDGDDYRVCGLSEAEDAIERLPSADRPQGEWIFKTVFPNDKSEFPMGYLVCSVCGSHHRNSTPCNYCDNCGARMKGADNEGHNINAK